MDPTHEMRTDGSLHQPTLHAGKILNLEHDVFWHLVEALSGITAWLMCRSGAMICKRWKRQDTSEAVLLQIFEYLLQNGADASLTAPAASSQAGFPYNYSRPVFQHIKSPLCHMLLPLLCCCTCASLHSHSSVVPCVLYG